MEPLTDGLSYTRREELEQRIPALRVLRVQYIELCDACARAALSGNGFEALEQRRQSFLRDMAAKQRDILESNGIDPKALNADYACPLCRDTGVVLENGIKHPCSCRIERQQQKRNAQLASYSHFSDFRTSVYQDTGQRDSAQRLKTILESYALQFPHNKKRNLLLFGNTGLGKTFFLGCLTRALHERGIHAELLPSYELFEGFRKQHLGQGTVMPRLTRLPFLSIDDLGVEPMYRNITVEYLNELLDLRLNRQLPMAIATNLDAASLCERYGERIASRLYDQRLFHVIGLRGKDLRKT